MTAWTWAALVAVWVLVVVFVLLGAAWNRDTDETAQRMFDDRNGEEDDQ